MPGQIRFRLRYRMLCDAAGSTTCSSRRASWSDSLRGTGWHVHRFISNDDDDLYAAVIDKDAS